MEALMQTVADFGLLPSLGALAIIVIFICALNYKLKSKKKGNNQHNSQH